MTHEPATLLPEPVWPSLTLDIEDVTPERAAAWLELNAELNRSPRVAKIQQYAHDMRTGNWEVNGETVKFDRDGNLVDGQHRLAAVVESGVTVRMAVARGLAPESLKTIDTGISRRFADVLKIHGHGKDGNIVGTTVRRVWLWDNGARANATGGNRGSQNPTNADLLKLYESDVAGFRMAGKRGRDVYEAARLLSTGTAGTAFYLLARVNYDDTNRFFDRFITGANLGTDHPILTLRQRLLRARTDPAGRLTEPERLALIIRAWNGYRTETPMSKLMLTHSGPLTNQNFPEPK